MRSEWKECLIGELVELKQGLAVNAKTKHLLKNEGLPLLRITDLLNNIHEQYVDGENAPAKCIVDYGDLIYTRTGQVGYIFNNRKGVVHNNCFSISPKTDKLSKDYIYWYFKQNKIRKYAESIASGSVQKDLNHGAFNSIPFSYPDSLDTQKKIAHILSTLDDKIELNRKMNKTLEEMAQVSFKSWFVDFDPVHAKAKCTNDAELAQVAKALGLSKEVLALFPSEFEESALGMIPKGWGVKPLDEIAHYQNGLALQKFRPKNEKYFLPVLKIAQLKKGFADTEEKADFNIKESCIVDSGDIVFSWSGSLVVDFWCGGKVALNQHLFKVSSDTYAKWFYYYWTKQHLANFQQIAKDKAVTMGHIKRSHLAEAFCSIPNEKLLVLAEKIINPLFEMIIANRLEVNSLQKTRDTLLPKLLSGELDVSDLEIEGVDNV